MILSSKETKWIARAITRKKISELPNGIIINEESAWATDGRRAHLIGNIGSAAMPDGKCTFEQLWSPELQRLDSESNEIYMKWLELDTVALKYIQGSALEELVYIYIIADTAAPIIIAQTERARICISKHGNESKLLEIIDAAQSHCVWAVNRRYLWDAAAEMDSLHIGIMPSLAQPERIMVSGRINGNEAKAIIMPARLGNENAEKM